MVGCQGKVGGFYIFIQVYFTAFILYSDNVYKAGWYLWESVYMYIALHSIYVFELATDPNLDAEGGERG